jgi:hypothetical protein
MPRQHEPSGASEIFVVFSEVMGNVDIITSVDSISLWGSGVHRF